MERSLSINHCQLNRQQKAARRLAISGREICGLLVTTDDYHLELVPVHNSSQRLGSFCIDTNWWRQAQRASAFHERDVVGTYHSHPSGYDKPGTSDVQGTWDGALMLIVSCSRHKTTLWRVKQKRHAAYPISFSNCY